MIGRYFYGLIAVAILVMSVSVTGFAQVGELRGHVVMQQADGQKVPLADAQIDVFRTDMKAKYNTKTNSVDGSACPDPNNAGQDYFSYFGARAHQVRQQVNRRPVGPVHVLDDEHSRLARGGGGKLEGGPDGRVQPGQGQRA